MSRLNSVFWGHRLCGLGSRLISGAVFVLLTLLPAFGQKVCFPELRHRPQLSPGVARQTIRPEIKPPASVIAEILPAIQPFLTTENEAVSPDGNKAPAVRKKLSDPPTEVVPIIVAPEPVIALPSGTPAAQFREHGGFGWRRAYQQSLLFLGIQHAFRLATEAGTREELGGPFLKDYFRSVGKLRAWKDGDPFLVNYIGHPMQGAVTGYIQIQNDPRGRYQEIGLDKAYWKSRLKAFAWNAVYSTQFEIGPLGEAAIGNVGLKPVSTSPHPMAWVDIVVTPTLGTAWLVGEDALDRWLVKPLERKVKKYPAVMIIRGFLNPSRSFANVLRGKWPWYRDDR